MIKDKRILDVKTCTREAWRRNCYMFRCSRLGLRKDGTMVEACPYSMNKDYSYNYIACTPKVGCHYMQQWYKAHNITFEEPHPFYAVDWSDKAVYGEKDPIENWTKA